MLCVVLNCWWDIRSTDGRQLVVMEMNSKEVAEYLYHSKKSHTYDNLNMNL